MGTDQEESADPKTVKTPHPTLIAIAEEVLKHFAELEGRAIAVSEVEPFDQETNVPTLPIVVVGLVGEEGKQNKNGGGNIVLMQDVMIQFILKPVKYNNAEGNKTPFFAFYDYEAIRDRMLTVFSFWRTPRNGGLAYKSMDVESDEFAVYIALRFTTEENWCKPAWVDELSGGDPIQWSIQSGLLTPGECCIPDCPADPDPCDPARLRNPFGKEAQAAADT